MSPNNQAKYILLAPRIPIFKIGRGCRCILLPHHEIMKTKTNLYRNESSSHGLGSEYSVDLLRSVHCLSFLLLPLQSKGLGSVSSLGIICRGPEITSCKRLPPHLCKIQFKSHGSRLRQAFRNIPLVIPLVTMQTSTKKLPGRHFP